MEAPTLDPSDGVSEFEHAYDPYGYKPSQRDPRRHTYAPYVQSWRYPRREEIAVGLERDRLSRPDSGVYGYVEPQDGALAPDRARTSTSPQVNPNWQFGYYYNRETGELRYGWHYEPPVASETTVRVRPAPPVVEMRRPIVPEPIYGYVGEDEEVRSFAGRIIETVTATGRTDNRVHLIARVQQPDGSYESVELGPLGTVNVREGDWIEGIGTEQTFQGRPTLFAREVSIDGMIRRIREFAPREARDYAGEVLSLRVVRLEDVTAPQTLAEVHVGQGTIHSVLLGPPDELRRIGLRAGDEITVWARQGSLDGLQVLVAKQLETRDRRLNINYDPTRFAFETR